jgi:hypothetical protein
VVNITSGTRDHNSWQGFTVTASDFVSLDTAQARAARNPDGSLPEITFMHLAPSSALIDTGIYVGIPYNGIAPDLGAYETPGSTTPLITVATSPSGRQITVDAVTYTAPQTFSWASGSLHSIGVSSPQGSSSTQYVYSSWSDAGAQTHTIIVPSNNTTYTANFTTQYQLAITANPSIGGTITTSPSSPSGWYNNGQSVQITAIANGGFLFANWSGDTSGSTNPVIVMMNAPRTIDAHFVVLDTIIASAGSNGSISPSGVSYVKYGDSLKYTITPDTGYRVDSVLVDNEFVGSMTSYTFTNVTSNHTISASFAVSQQTTLVEVSTGWSLVSIPRIQLNDSANVVFTGKYGSMFGFSPVLGDYVEALTLEQGFGYWVFYLSGTTVTISGPAPDTLKINAKAGWNLIGSRETEVQVANLQVSAGSILGVAFKYDPSIGDYTETTVIPLGQGIWIFVTADCIITWPK